MTDELNTYECEIAVVVEARTPQEAATLAQCVIDENTETWLFDVRDLDSDEVYHEIEGKA